MGLYDDDGSGLGEAPNSEEIGKALLKSKKPKKGFKSDIFDWSMPPLLNKILLYTLVGVLAVIVIYGGYLALQPNMISYKSSPNPIYLSDSTSSQLAIEVENVEDFTMKNVELIVSPTDNLSVVVMPSDKLSIPILGPNETRKYDYTIELIGNAPEGEYEINIRVKTPAKIYDKTAMWTVKKIKG
jgi:hypothetical protein